MGSDQRRVFLAVVLSGVVLVVWQTFFAPKVSVDDKIKAYEERGKVYDKQAGTSNADKAFDGTPSREVIKSSSAKVESHTLDDGKINFSFNNSLEIEGSQNKNAIIDFVSTVGRGKPFQIQVLTPTGPQAISLDWKVSDDGKS
ncbi:MAG: hypothetical protein VXW15_13670, partial [Bdellovibrionota bacterium]|nr:hypothetical protein [Bdellovibrionota bacterium]